MKIIVHRQKRIAEGWLDLEPITLGPLPPERAYEYVRARKEGPVGPTDEEITRACRDLYEHAQSTRAAMGDLCVTRVEIIEFDIQRRSRLSPRIEQEPAPFDPEERPPLT